MLTVDFDRLRVEPGMRALDVGCGQGRHSLEFLRRGCPVVSLDLLPHDLRYTRYLLTALGRELPPPASGGGPPPFLALRATALQLPFPDGRFDRVVCSEVLEHVADPAAAARELARVLRPGGWLAVSVPTPFTEWAFRFASDDYFNTPGGHVRIFSARRLKGLLAGAGLAVRDLNFEHAFHSLYWWVRGVFGLHDEGHPAIRHGKKILTHTLFSRELAWGEGVLNHVIPKSMVLYARREGEPEDPPAPEPRAGASLRVARGGRGKPKNPAPGR